MKKFLSILVSTVMLAVMLPAVVSAFEVDTITLGDGIRVIVVKGEAGNGGLTCDKLVCYIPGFDCPEHDSDTPSGDTGIIPPVQDNDAPTGDTGTTPPVQDNDMPSGDTGSTPPVQDNDTPSGDAGVTPPVQDNDTPSIDSSMHEYEKEVVRLVNEIRVANGLSELAADEELSHVARTKSQDMKDNNYFSHISPVYGSPFDMMKDFGVSYRTAGENIAKGYTTPQAVVDAWMNSSGHRANILNASYNTIGVGYVADGNYWTQMFVGR